MNHLLALKRTTKHKRRYCRIEGCTKIVKSQGVCQRHGAKPRKCKIPGCAKQAQGNFHGMCKSHGRLTALPLTRTSSSMMTTKDSPRDVCLLVNHVPMKIVSSPPSCDDGASHLVLRTPRTPQSHPATNYYRLAPSWTLPQSITSSSSPEPSFFKSNNRRTCTVKGCSKVIKSQGVCQRHGAKPARCKISGCAKQAQGGFNGMCKAHHQMLGTFDPYQGMPYGQHESAGDLVHRYDLSPSSVLDRSTSIDSTNYRREELRIDSSAPFYPRSYQVHPMDTTSASSTYDLQPRAVSDTYFDTSVDFFFDPDDSNPFEPIAFNPAWSVSI